MTTDSARGFTIIEVVLFLAISGAIFSALMLGVGTGIAQQRYIESVRSFKAILQNEFEEVQNTHNGEAVDVQCDVSTRTVVDGSSSRTPTRGSSQCVMLGRAIQLTNGGSSVKVSSVIGYEDAVTVTTVGEQNDVAALRALSPQFGAFQSDEIDLDWGSRVRLPGQASNAVVTILIMRSPSSGIVRVFASTDVASTDIIDNSNSGVTAMVDSCVVAEGIPMPSQLVRVNPGLGTTEAVKIVSPDDPAVEACQS